MEKKRVSLEAFSTENPLLANLQVSYKFASGPSEDLHVNLSKLKASNKELWLKCMLGSGE